METCMLYCAFMYTVTEKHVCFHVISLFSAHFDPTGKVSITSKCNHRLGVCLHGSYMNYEMSTWKPSWLQLSQPWDVNMETELNAAATSSPECITIGGGSLHGTILWYGLREFGWHSPLHAACQFPPWPHKDKATTFVICPIMSLYPNL